MPGTASVSSGGGSGTATSTTTGEDTTGGFTTTSSMTTTTAGTSTSTSTTSNETDDPVGPPVPCEGEGQPLVGITTQIGYLQSQIPPDQGTTGGMSTTTTDGGDFDPGTLFLKLSDQAFTCADPTALLACGPHWEVTITIPPEFQSPGVHNLLGQDVWGSAFETGSGNDCSFGGGSFGGTFEILAIDDDTVEARLCNINAPFFDVDPQLNGIFTADRCPG